MDSQKLLADPGAQLLLKARKPKLTITRGLPASGKTTWAKKQVLSNPAQIKRVNKDDLRDMLHAGKWTRGLEKSIIRARDDLVIAYLFDGKDVIVDDTNLAGTHIKDLTYLAGELGAGVEVKDFYLPPSVCVERDAFRDKPVGSDVIYRMWRDHVVKPAPEFNPDLPTTVLVDIDGTVATMTGRSPYDYSKVHTDAVVEKVQRLVNRQAHYIFLSGREDGCREETLKWLEKNNFSVNALLMRKHGDHRPDWIVKREIYENEIKGRWNVDFVIDDRQQVVDMWREEGLTCFAVADGHF